ncbi:WhiB family transcriptional regulator [Streptomyces sp. NPDC006283]|uniref:WhiB family transcriptional regulator n=1 Tax=Streptomyces sp. NPDC006283 TaxID=3156741 RepID=UPI0033B94A37
MTNTPSANPPERTAMNQLLPDFLTLGRASCTATPDLFWSRIPDDEQAAKSLCHTCPLLLDCQTWAIDQREDWGTWGGLTATDRLRLRRGNGWWVDLEGRIRHPCGTAQAIGQHRKFTDPCDVCEAAEAQRIEEQRRAVLAVEHALAAGGSVRGYDTHRRLGEEACGPCKAAKARASATKPDRPKGRARRAAQAAAAAGPLALAS